MRRSLKLAVVTLKCGHTLAVVTSCLACTKKLTKLHRKVSTKQSLWCCNWNSVRCVAWLVPQSA